MQKPFGWKWINLRICYGLRQTPMNLHLRSQSAHETSTVTKSSLSPEQFKVSVQAMAYRVQELRLI